MTLHTYAFRPATSACGVGTNRHRNDALVCFLHTFTARTFCDCALYCCVFTLLEFTEHRTIFVCVSYIVLRCNSSLQHTIWLDHIRTYLPFDVVVDGDVSLASGGGVVARREPVALRLVLDVVAEGPTRTLRICDEAAFYRQLRGMGPSGLQRDTASATIAGDSGRAGVQLQVSVRGVGVSVIDSTPAELMYACVSDLKVMSI